MAEAVGLAAAIIQIAQLGLKCSQTLYRFSHSVSNHSSSIERLQAHVETNSQVLRNLAALLDDDQSLNEHLRGDIERAAKNCHRVFEQIVTIFESMTHSKSSIHKAFNKAKYAAVLEKQVKDFRQELQEHQVTLNLVLLIHWQSDVSGTRNAVVELLKNGLAHASNSKVPVVADTVNDIITSLGITEAPAKSAEDTSHSISETVPVSLSNPSSRSSTLAPTMSLFSRPSLGHSSASSITTSRSLKPTESPQPTSRAVERDLTNPGVRTMWDARVGKDKRLAFEQRAIARLVIDDFVRERASKLLEALADLDPSIARDLQSHAVRLDEVLLAIHVYRKESTFSRRKISSINFVTENQKMHVVGGDQRADLFAQQVQKPPTAGTTKDDIARFAKGTAPARLASGDDTDEDEIAAQRRTRGESQAPRLRDEKDFSKEQASIKIADVLPASESIAGTTSKESLSRRPQGDRTPEKTPVFQGDPHRPAQAPPIDDNIIEEPVIEAMESISATTEQGNSSLYMSIDKARARPGRLRNVLLLPARAVRSSKSSHAPEQPATSTATAQRKRKSLRSSSSLQQSHREGFEEEQGQMSDETDIAEPKEKRHGSSMAAGKPGPEPTSEPTEEIDDTYTSSADPAPIALLDDQPSGSLGLGAETSTNRPYKSSAGPTPIALVDDSLTGGPEVVTGLSMDDTYTSSAGPTPIALPDDRSAHGTGSIPETSTDRPYKSSVGPTPIPLPDDPSTSSTGPTAGVRQEEAATSGPHASSYTSDRRRSQPSTPRSRDDESPFAPRPTVPEDTLPTSPPTSYAARIASSAGRRVFSPVPDSFAARQALDAARQARQAQQPVGLPSPPVMPLTPIIPPAAAVPDRVIYQDADFPPAVLGSRISVDRFVQAGEEEVGADLVGLRDESSDEDDEDMGLMLDEEADVLPQEDAGSVGEEPGMDANLAAIAEQLVARLGARWNA